jgi:hypothetical protein
MRWVRVAVAAIVVAVLATTPVARAQVLPQPPPVPTPPAQLQPLLELLAPVGGVVTQPGCAALGTVLGLGTLAIPGLPGTIEQQTGLPLSALPIALQPELLSFVDTLLYVQGSGCGLLPLAAERTVCASDDDIAAQAANVRAQLNLPGLPVQLGDFAPEPAPTAGAIVDTFRVLATLGVPGAADVVAALNNAGTCELRTRFTNVEPPPVPPDAAYTSPPAPPMLADDVAPLPVPAAPVFNAVPAAAPARATAPTQIAAAPARVSGLPAIGQAIPNWLQWLAVAALIAFLYRAIAPAREQAS